MDCFIKEIWNGRGEEAHQHFVRFSKGVFENRAVLNLMKTSRVKLRGSFEWANDFVEIAAELDGMMKFSGIVFSKEEIPELAEFSKKKKQGLVQYEVGGIGSSVIEEIKNRVYAMLVDGEGEGLSLKMKKKLPKPGKSGEGKTDDKFCKLETGLGYWNVVREAFMLPECKRCKISHIFVIEEIVMPEDEKDFEKIRKMAKRKGKVIRKTEIDKQEHSEERGFEA